MSIRTTHFIRQTLKGIARHTDSDTIMMIDVDMAFSDSDGVLQYKTGKETSELNYINYIIDQLELSSVHPTDSEHTQ